MHKIVILILICVAQMAAEDALRIDGSSKEAMNASVNSITDSMPKEKIEVFKKALIVVLFDGDPLKTTKIDREDNAIRFRLAIKDKTADEVIALADAIRARVADKKADARHTSARTSIDEPSPGKTKN